MREYLEKLMARDEMRIVERQVDPRFELAAVIARSSKESEAPILFRNVKGTDFPVVANVYGSHRRLCEMLGVEDGRLCQGWSSLMESVGKVSARFNEITDPDDMVSGRMSDLPHITYREKDLGPYFTSGVFLAIDPDSGVPNLSFSRIHLVNDSEAVCCIDPPNDLARYQANAERLGAPLDVAIMIGAPPPVFLAACALVPINVNELEIAAQINGGELTMRPCKTIPLHVPADAEIVIEARMLPDIHKSEGPFGEVMGYYGPVNANGYVLEIKKVTWKRNAYFQALLCGSRDDLTVLDVVLSGCAYHSLSNSLPGILDVACIPTPLATIVRIRKEYEGHPQHVILKVFGDDHILTNCCIVVDEDVDVRNMDEVWWSFLTRGPVDTRTMIIPDVPYFEREPEYRGRIGIDATKPLDLRHKFVRNYSPGEHEIDLGEYLSRKRKR